MSPSQRLVSDAGADLWRGPGAVTVPRGVFVPPEPEPDPGLGVIGDRPAVLTKPTAGIDAGPRESTTSTMSGSAALAAVLAATPEGDGKRYLRRVNITSSISFTQASHSNIVFEDCVIDGSFASYTVRGFWLNNDGVPPTTASWPEFRYCEIRDAASSCTIGSQVRYLRCSIHHGLDLAKPFGVGGEFYACHMYDTWHPAGAHCDVVQIVSGASGFLFHGNNMEGFNSADSPTNAGLPASGVLQTGTVTGNIGLVQWLDNWFDGAGYTIRGVNEGDTSFAVNYLFRRNRFGRGYTFGPTRALGKSGIDFDASNVFDDTGTPV